MGFTYRLVVEEDLDALGAPVPGAGEVAALWREDAGDAPLPAAMERHVAHAWRVRWLAQHRASLLGELDAALRWAGDDVGWRPLLDALPELHRRFYSERPDAYFPARELADALAEIRASGVPAGLERDLGRLERASGDLARHGLRFRFDFLG